MTLWNKLFPSIFLIDQYLIFFFFTEEILSHIINLAELDAHLMEVNKLTEGSWNARCAGAALRCIEGAMWGQNLDSKHYLCSLLMCSRRWQLRQKETENARKTKLNFSGKRPDMVQMTTVFHLEEPTPGQKQNNMNFYIPCAMLSMTVASTQMMYLSIFPLSNYKT